MSNEEKTVFISADHGLAIVYFLQSDVVPQMLAAGLRVVLLTDDVLREQIHARFGQPGLIIEGLRLKEANHYARHHWGEVQWWLNFLRRVGGSYRINIEAMESYVQQVRAEEPRRRAIFFPLARATVELLRRSAPARKALVQVQTAFTTHLYADLFERYQPELVIASTPGWRLDRYLLREAHARGVKTAAVIVGWDNSSSYSIPGAPVDWITCWSQQQKDELVYGSDWAPERVHIGGIPSYDGYFRKLWLIPRQEYFSLHELDPERKLISYAASFVSFSPNYQNIEALAQLVASDALAQPSQLLVRLHPNHFWDHPLFAGERKKIMGLAKNTPHMHVVEPVPLGGSLGYYSGEDMPEKASMMAHSDVFCTVYSTMVVEAAIHERPIVSVCIDAPGGWNTPRKFSLPLSQIGNWPTHLRFREANAGRVALDQAALRQAINASLDDQEAGRAKQRAFIDQECTFTDGSAGQHTAQFLISLV